MARFNTSEKRSIKTYELAFDPFDSEFAVGRVCKVGHASIQVLLFESSSSSVSADDIGGFFIVEARGYGVFGRIISVDSSFENAETERIAGQSGSVATIQLLNSLDLDSGGVFAGVKRLPKAGDTVYAANPKLVQWVVESNARKGNQSKPVMLSIARMNSAQEIPLRFTPEMMFGRHCAVVGSTGGGKSWTISRIVEETAKFRSKVILFDATGEFEGLDQRVSHVYLGNNPAPNPKAQEVVVPYYELTERDLFAIFRPTGTGQAPKLRSALQSLKLAYLEPSVAPNGAISKANKTKAAFERAIKKHIAKIEAPYCPFDIRKLPEQILKECVHPYRSELEPHIWGDSNSGDKSRCIPLVNRIEDILSSPNLHSIFYPQGKRSLLAEVRKFLKDDSVSVLRISLEYLAYDHHAREIITNSIGKHLLEMAREEKFRNQPMLLVLDEAHQFLNKTLSDDDGEYSLDSFAIIAKEGRKYALNICVATQRPRDIPEGVLSQMGTFIVHRLTNDADRHVIERASSDLDRNSLGYLPALAPGEALIVGNDFPIPLTVSILEPDAKPNSEGPNYQNYWGRGPLG